MTILEAYKKLESELSVRATFSIDTDITRHGARAGKLGRIRIEYIVTIQDGGRLMAQKSGHDLFAVVAMALDEFAPTDANEDRIAEASAQDIEAIDVLQI